MVRTTAASAFSLLALLVACGDDEVIPDASIEYDAAVIVADAAPPPDAEPPPDAGPPDATACAARVAPEIGAPCTADADCGTGGFCLNAAEDWPAVGYCTRQCIGDFQCGDGICSEPLGGGAGTLRLCFAPCCAGSQCDQADHACTDTLYGFLGLGGDACLPATPDAADGAACEGFFDCAPSSMCTANPFDSPGGYCITVGCTVGDDSTCASGGDGHCVDLNPADSFPATCVDACSVGTDCREDEGYACVDVGGPFGKICLAQHADPGAACANDAACGDPPWECLTGDAFPNGYCGADACDPTVEASCPGGSFCYDAAPGTLDGSEHCAARCNPAADPPQCRTDDGYACTDLGDGNHGCVVPPGG